MEKNYNRTHHRLTHDELKAAEAAFQGWPLNDAWSAAAQIVYRGILAAKMKLSHERFSSDVIPNDEFQPTEVLMESATVDSEIERTYRL